MEASEGPQREELVKLMEKRITNLEKEFEYNKIEGFQKVVDYTCSKFGENVDLYFPRFLMLEDEVSTFKAKMKIKTDEQDKHSKILETDHAMIDSIKRDIEFIKIQQGHKGRNEYDELREKLYSQSEHIDLLKQSISRLASSERLEFVEARLRELATFNQFLELDSQLKKMPSYDEILRLQGRLDELRNETEVRLRVDDFDSHMEKLSASLRQTLETKLSIEAYNESISSFQEMFTQKLEEMEEAQLREGKRLASVSTELRILQEVVKEMKNELKQKTDKDESMLIWKNFDKYAAYSDYKELYKKVMPAISGFENQLVEFLKEQEKNNFIIRRFDEIISDKASKTHIKELQEEIRALPTMKMVTEQIQKVQQIDESQKQKFSQLEEGIDLLGKQISREILNAVKKAFANLNTQKETQNGNLQALHMAEDFKLLLSNKAEKQEVQELVALKSSKVDMELSFKWIDILHKQIKQIAVLLTQHSKLLVEPQSESKHQSENQKVFLLQQAMIILQWINQFDAKKPNDCQEQEDLPHKLKQFSELQQDKLQEIEMFSLSPNNQLLNSSVKMRSKSIANQKTALGNSLFKAKQSMQIQSHQMNFNTFSVNMKKSFMSDRKEQTDINLLEGLKTVNFENNKQREGRSQSPKETQSFLNIVNKHEESQTSDQAFKRTAPQGMFSKSKINKVRFDNSQSYRQGQMLKTAQNASPFELHPKPKVLHPPQTQHSQTNRKDAESSRTYEDTSSLYKQLLDQSLQIYLPGIYNK